MEEKKLTDEEVVKAIVKSIEYSKAITYFDEWGNCKSVMMTDVIDLIHRLQAENETLKSKKFANWKLKFFKVQEELETLKKDYIFLELDRNELRIELDKELTEHEEFTKQTKAEVERLMEEVEKWTKANDSKMVKIVKLEDQVDELTEELEQSKNMYDDIRKCNEILLKEDAELQKQVKDSNKTLDLWQDDIHYLQCDKAELQKQVDELKDIIVKLELGYYPISQIRENMEEEKQQAVKDTAKEILIPLIDCEKQIDPLQTGIRWSVLKGFCKKFGVEVE